MTYRGLCVALAVDLGLRDAKTLIEQDWQDLGLNPAELAGKPTAWRLVKIRSKLIVNEAVDEGMKCCDPTNC
jgi:hypothetical protein